MMELVDIRDLKSLALTGVPVRLRVLVPNLTSWNDAKLTLVGARLFLNLTH